VELPRKLVHTVYAELEGYEPVYAYIDRIASPVRYANAFLTGFGLLGLSGLVAGLVGLGMDSDLGSAYELTPETLKIQLAPLPAAPAAPAPSSTASR
jgi:hypothetical protein